MSKDLGIKNSGSFVATGSTKKESKSSAKTRKGGDLRAK